MPEITLKPRVYKGGRPRKHGAYSFLRTGIIPKGKEHLAQMADAAITRMATDLGGLENLSGNQIVILREIRQLMIYKFIVDEKIMTEGLFKPGANIELQGPLNAFYLSCSNSITRNCGLLGLKKVSPAADDLAGYLKKQYPTIYDVTQTKGKAAAGPAMAIESGKPLSKRARGKRSSITEASEEVKENG
jgi:hypothetical protein